MINSWFYSPINTSVTSVNFYQATRRNNPEGSHRLILRCFAKICWNIGIFVKSDNNNNNNGHLTRGPACVSGLHDDWVGNSHPGNSVTIHRGQMSNSDERSRIATLCVHFLPCY
jgi:hypothetical protein